MTEAQALMEIAKAINHFVTEFVTISLFLILVLILKKMG